MQWQQRSAVVCSEIVTGASKPKQTQCRSHTHTKARGDRENWNETFNIYLHTDTCMCVCIEYNNKKHEWNVALTSCKKIEEKKSQKKNGNIEWVKVVCVCVCMCCGVWGGQDRGRFISFSVFLVYKRYEIPLIRYASSTTSRRNNLLCARAAHHITSARFISNTPIKHVAFVAIKQVVVCCILLVGASSSYNKIGYKIFVLRALLLL